MAFPRPEHQPYKLSRSALTRLSSQWPADGIQMRLLRGGVRRPRCQLARTLSGSQRPSSYTLLPNRREPEHRTPVRHCARASTDLRRAHNHKSEFPPSDGSSTETDHCDWSG